VPAEMKAEMKFMARAGSFSFGLEKEFGYKERIKCTQFIEDYRSNRKNMFFESTDQEFRSVRTKIFCGDSDMRQKNVNAHRRDMTMMMMMIYL
jgi:hypothetical protein